MRIIVALLFSVLVVTAADELTSPQLDLLRKQLKTNSIIYTQLCYKLDHARRLLLDAKEKSRQSEIIALEERQNEILSKLKTVKDEQASLELAMRKERERLREQKEKPAK